MAVLALLGVQTAFFVPAKYGILPEILPHERLSAGNGLLEMSSNMAILAGIVAGGLILLLVGAHTWLGGLILALLANNGSPIADYIYFSVPDLEAVHERAENLGCLAGEQEGARDGGKRETDAQARGDEPCALPEHHPDDSRARSTERQTNRELPAPERHGIGLPGSERFCRVEDETGYAVDGRFDGDLAGDRRVDPDGVA